MPWYFPWSENIKKGLCRYLLHRFLGQFLEEKLTLDQLTVDLYNGIGSVSDVALDVNALNELGEQQNLPIEFIDGFISGIFVSIPWSSLLTDSSCVEVNGLNLVVQPKQRVDNGASMFESMWSSSMTSSIQLAEECLKHSSERIPEQPNPVNGMEEFAKTIESILTKVKLKFLNTVIRLEHLPKDSKTGVALELHIEKFSYYDETSTEVCEDCPMKPASAYAVKVFSLEGVEFYTYEFYASDRTISRSLLTESTLSLGDENEGSEKKRRNSFEDIILFGKLIGKQEVRLKVKQKENVSGPKIDLQISLSSFIILISPRQLRTIFEVVLGLMSPHLQDTSNVVSKSRYNQKPMTTSDFERVEQELTHQISPSNLGHFVAKSLQNTAGWSSGGIDDESDDDFHPFRGQSSSLTSSVANSVSSSYSSNISSYQYQSKLNDRFSSSQLRHYHSRKYKEKGVSLEPDFNGDINKFELKLNFLAIILLHQDILLSSDDVHLPDNSMVDQMKTLAKQFFSYCLALDLSSYVRNDVRYEQFMAVVERNHFRLFCTTLMVNSDEKSNPTSSEFGGSFTIANVELIECLLELENKKPEFVELILFNGTDSNVMSDSSLCSQPNVMMHFKHFKNLKQFSQRNRTELIVNLRPLSIELDVTIIDRLIHITDNFKILWKEYVKPSDSAKSALNDVHALSIDSKFEWKITASFVTIKFRFPIPDLRTEFDDPYLFWHQRNIHNDILFVDLSETSLQSTVSNYHVAKNFEVQCRSVRISFKESNSNKAIPFIFSGVDEKFGMSLPDSATGFGWPRLVLRLYPKVNYVELEEDIEEKLDPSLYMGQSIMQTQKQEASPFSAKMIMRESDTSHSKSTPNYDDEEIILPGSKEEIGEFIESANNNALIQLEIILPTVIIQIPSKHLFEVIYNRFNTDLLLWTPKTHNPSFSSEFSSSKPNLNFDVNPTGSLFTSFSMCKSMVKNNSDSEDEGPCDDAVFNTGMINQPKNKKIISQQQSKIAVSIFAAQGVFDIFPHARDSSGKVIPGQFGEVQLMFHEANLFLVSNYKGESSLNYVCLQINHCSLYHSNLIPSNADMTMKPIDSYPSKYVLPTMYKTQSGGIVNENAPQVGVGSTTSEDMLTLAIRIQEEEIRLKNVCVANSLNGVTIRHRMKPQYTSWLSQLIDFFDVADYPVPHYQPWKVITQLHQQLLNCVIDYRPLYLPMRAALTVENFNISSNITTKTSTSILSFIAEEASLFISTQINDTELESLPIDLKNNYVCVVELGLFELSLRLTDDGNGEPQTDLRASNNIIHIRTCADSAVALMELVKYIASDGDLRDVYCSDEYKVKKSSKSNSDVLVHLKGGKPVEVADNEPYKGEDVTSDNSVPHLVEEAMNDTTDVKPIKKRNVTIKRRDKSKVEMFFFPDEENMTFSPDTSQTFTDSQSSDDDAEKNGFFIVEQEVGIGYLGKSSTPEVKLLTLEPIRVVDNHFTVPVNKVDVLKAPKSYPPAVSKYTLREITIVWHMYGGHDFEKKSSEDAEISQSKKQVTIVSNRKSSTESLSGNFDGLRLSRKSSADNVSVLYSTPKSSDTQAVNFVISHSSPRVSFNDCKKDSPTVLYDRMKSCSWQARGGVNRQHDVLMELKLTKLKYQYEIYPKNTKQASRQILVIQEIEISDRMATSQINKFLYLYSSTTRPKQSHANMVVIKATNIRPEMNVSHRQECCLRVSLLPLRLNIDQDSLLFLINFFTEISGNKNEDVPVVKTSPLAKPTIEPVMNIEKMNSSKSPSLMIQFDDEELLAAPVEPSSPIFIRSFIFSPDVPIRVDYEGKRVDLSHGPVAGLIMGLGQLNCSELKLKRLCNRHGFLGLEKLISYVLTEWLQDIKKNQLPSILGGVGPMYSLVQLFQGIRDLFWLPIEQYQKDGRIVRGLQRGANSFTTSTAMAALELTARLVYAIQRIAETAFDLVSPGPSIRYLRNYDKTGKADSRRCRRHHHKYSQPADIREGVASALQLFKEGFEETAQTLIRVACVENEVKGAVGAVGGLAREIPSAALTPIILATRATSNVLDGVRSHLVPDAKTEAALKWKNDYFESNM